MNNTIKTLLKLAAVAAVAFFGSPLILTAVIGWGALKIVDVVEAGVAFAEGRRERLTGVSATDAKAQRDDHNRKTRVKYYDNVNHQWDLRNLPLDMTPKSVGSASTSFTCNGIDDLVYGRCYGNNRYDFYMDVKDIRRVEEMRGYIKEKGIIGTGIIPLEDGGFRINCDNAEDMSVIVKEFFPPRTMTVDREISTTSQYIVSGCKSYEEAYEKFVNNRDSYRPAGTFVSYQDTVDGVKDVPFISSEDALLDISKLQVGEFVINETTSDFFSKNVTFNPGIADTDAAARSLASAEASRIGFDMDHDLVEDKCVVKPVLSDGLKDTRVERYILHKGNEIAVNDKLVRDYVDEGKLNLILAFDNYNDLLNVKNGDISLTGQHVLIDTVVPSPQDGKFILSLPVDRETMEALGLQAGLDASLEKYTRLGVPAGQIEELCLLSEVKGKGYATALLKDSPDFSQAIVNGVPAGQFEQRMTNLVDKNLCEEISDVTMASRWLEDAALIKSVSMDLDLKNSELVISSTIGNENHFVTKEKREKLDEKKITELQARGMISNVELKDLVMKLYPDQFSFYRYPGTPKEAGVCRYENVIDAFIEGRKPSENLTFSKALNETKNNNTVSNKQKQDKKMHV